MNLRILADASKITAISVIMSMLATVCITYLRAGGTDLFATRLSWGLPIAAVVPLVIAMPISIYVLLQRQKIATINEELAYLLKYDPLTTLLTRRAFFQQAEEALKKGPASSQTCALLYVDLDRFKQINDQFGHAFGDKILMLLGKVIKENLGSDICAGRLGGEEFCIFLPNCPAENAFTQSQKLVDDFKDQAQTVDGVAVNATMSIGVVVSTMDDCLDNMINRADKLLYKAKRSGRNRVEKSSTVPMAA